MRFALHQVLAQLRDSTNRQPLPQKLAAGARFLAGSAAWQLRARAGGRIAWTRPERLTVILLSFKRVRSIDPIVRSLLPLESVERIVVCNNNPAYRMAEWLSASDPRLELIERPVETFCGVRFELARRGPGEHFLAVDDDVFLRPEQAQALFEALLTEPERSHGVRGQRFPPGPVRGWGEPIEGRDGEVDVLNQVYAFTRRHVEELYRLADAIGEDVVDCIADDALLSYGGEARPRCHDVGPILRCLSADQEGVAVYRTLEEFPERRARILDALRALKPELAGESG